MGIFSMFSGSPANKSEVAPREPEEKRKEESEAPKLSVVEGEKKEPEAEEESGASSSAFWNKQRDEMAEAASKRFQAANNFFRQLKAEGKAESGKWDKESARYKAWMEAGVQVALAERISAEYKILEDLGAQYDAVPDIFLPSERAKQNVSFETYVKHINDRAVVSRAMQAQEIAIRELSIRFAEAKLRMEEYDAEVSSEDAAIAADKEAAAQKAEHEAGLAEARAAYNALDAAERELDTKRSGFLNAVRFIFWRSKGQKEAVAKVKSAERLKEEIYSKHFAGSAGSYVSEALGRYQERQAQYQEDMRRAGGLYF